MIKDLLSTNSLMLQQYNFPFIELETVIFFEWLIVKKYSFRKKKIDNYDFFYSSKRATNETGIKRRKLEKVISILREDFEIIQTKIDGNPKVTHFALNFENIVSREFIKYLYKEQYRISAFKEWQNFKRLIELNDSHKPGINHSLPNTESFDEFMDNFQDGEDYRPNNDIGTPF
ncbi:hypothetical protein [uncultured Winogradskyella sp.]|uniref:hypothetical protein n=1 Tax=uncultured Winogradskyella sp. TaxID=395353 RepID=UPI00260A04EB|nr:hypothetical protein [uncultured Winogradskyella sp.]